MIGKKNKKYKVYLLLILLLMITVGYAGLSGILKIDGIAKIDENIKWNIHFENLKVTEGSVLTDENDTAKINVDKTSVSYKVYLQKPGDFYEFTVDAVNDGTIDAMINTIDNTNIPDEYKDYILYTLTYTDDREVKVNDSLGHGKLRRYKVHIRFKDEVEELPSESFELNLKLKINYVQADENATEYHTDSIVMQNMQNKFNNSESFYKYKDKITSIETKQDVNTPGTVIRENGEFLKWDLSEKQDKSVIAYLEDDGKGNKTYKLTIGGDGGKIIFPEDCTAFFRDFNIVESMDLKVVDTSKVTNMRYFFHNCSSLKSIDLSQFDTSNVINIVGMFLNCQSLVNLDLSHFDTSNVTTSMEDMFANCAKLKSLNVSNFDTKKITNMWHMFNGCSSLTSLDLSSFDTSNVSNMECMFYDCRGLTSLDLSSFDTSNVLNMEFMFYDCRGLTSLDLNHFDTSKVTNTYGMFNGCSKLTTTITISNSVTSYGGMFSDAATDENAKITVNYKSNTSDLVDNMIATKSENSNVVKGELVS